MNILRRSGFALLGLLLCLSGTTAHADDPARHLPGDTLAYVGWDRILDDSNAGILKAIPPLLDLADADAGGQLLMVMPLLEKALRADGAVALLGLDWDSGPMPRFAVVIDGPGRDILNTIDQMHGDTPEEAVGGVQLKSAGGFAWGIHRDTFFFCSRAAADTVVDALIDPGKSLFADDRFKNARGQARVKQSDWHLTLYADLAGTLDRLKTVSDEAGDPAPPQFWQTLDELGIRQINRALVHASGEDDYIVNRMFLGYEGTPKGLLKLWEQQPVAANDLNRVPRDAYWASVCNLNLGEVWEEVARVIGEVDEEMLTEIEGGDAMAASMLGFSPTQDLLPILGDTWIWHDAPRHGGFLFTGSVLQVESSDPEGLHAIFARLMQIAAPVAAAQEVQFEIRQAEHNGHKLDYLSLPGLPMPIAPTVAYHDGFAIVGLHPQTVKVVLNHLDEPAKAGGLAGHDDVKAAMARLGGNLQAVYYTDSRYITRLSYGLNHLLQTAAVSLAGADIASLPTLDEVLSGMGAAVGGCRRVDGGVLYESYARGGAPAMLPTNAALIGLAGGIMLPAVSEARDTARETVSASQMRQLAVAMHTYAQDHDGKFPDTMEELFVAEYAPPQLLVAPNDWQEAVTEEDIAALRAQGVLTPDQPGSGLLRTSYVIVTGQNAKSDPRNVLMYEETRVADQPAAVFVDGHVERMDWYVLRQNLQQTYERLGRSDELPEEFR